MSRTSTYTAPIDDNGDEDPENFTGTGNALNNIITGGDLDDVLNGLAGNDTLKGDDGTDVLNGGDDDDTYSNALDDGSDTINEVAAEGAADRIVIQTAGAALTGLSANDDNTGTNNGDLEISYNGQTTTVVNHFDDGDAQTGVELINFTGGSFAGYALGVATMSSAAPTRQATGPSISRHRQQTTSSRARMAPSDIITGGSGNDLIFGGSGDNQLVGGGGADLLVGGGDNDTLNGGTGSDIMIGGDDNDIYVVDDCRRCRGGSRR